MTTHPETFEDIDLEDVHGTFNNSSGNHNYARPIQPNNKPLNSISNQFLGPFKSLLPIIIKFKNLVLMIPALFILCIISFVSYCTLILAVPYRIHESSENGSIIIGIIYLLLAICFIITSILTLSSFIRCVFTSSSVCDNPPSISATHINNETCRKCQKCLQFKPSRAHHCSICSACVLKMDHHCPWVSNCVGYYNYKYFCLFVWFATFSCHISSLICFTQLFTLLNGHSRGRIRSGYNGLHSSWMMINSLLTLAFGITLTCFSLFHLTLVFKGSTTIEFGSDAYVPYNLGWKKNFYSVFGENFIFWFLPIPTMNGDGYEFVQNDEDNRGLLEHHNRYHQSDDDNHSNDSMINQDNQDDEISDFSTDLTS
eukprot:59962_1